MRSIGLPERRPQRRLGGLLKELLPGFHVPEAGHVTCLRTIYFYNLLIVAESVPEKNQAPLLAPLAQVGTDFDRLTPSQRQRPMDSYLNGSC